MKAKARFTRLVPASNRVPLNPGQWIRGWPRQLLGVLDSLGLGNRFLDGDDLMLMLADPNRGRIPTRVSFGGCG